MIITETPPENKPPSVGDIQKKKRIEYREWRDSVAQLLQERHYFDAAERWDYCDTSPRYKINRSQPDLPPSAVTVWVCSAASEHDAVLFSPSCDFRICPDCAPKHTARLVARYIPVIGQLMTKYPKYRLRTLTFTRSIKLGQAGFKQAAQDGFELIKKVMRRAVGSYWNKDGAGLLVNWEVGENGYKLHYHAIYFGNWVDQKLLSKEWKIATGGDFVVWVSAVKHNDGDWQGAIMETLKYATKFYKDDKATGKRKYLSPELTVELFAALKGTRRIRSWGSLYRIETPEERVFCCEQCQSKMIRIGIEYWEVWVNTGFSPVEWKRIVRDAVLNLRIANKSPPKQAKTDNEDAPHPVMLPVFDKIPVIESSHYDYE